MMAMSVERSFEHYYDFPPEMRRTVIDQMDPCDRVRFTRCSFTSKKEAQQSPNYMEGLELHVRDSTCLYYIVSLYSNNHSSVIYYKKERGTNYMFSKDANGRELWKTKLDSSVDIMLLAVDRFKDLMFSHHRKLKKLAFCGSFSGSRWRNIDFGVPDLRKLEALEMDGNMKIGEYLATVRQPLKKFSANSFEKNIDLSNFKEIYDVQEEVTMFNSKFTYEQLLRLSASQVNISIGDLSEMDIFNYIRSWQAGNWSKPTRITWKKLEYSTFDVDMLIELLGLEDQENVEFFDNFYEVRRHDGEIRLLWLDRDYSEKPSIVFRELEGREKKYYYEDNHESFDEDEEEAEDENEAENEDDNEDNE